VTRAFASLTAAALLCAAAPARADGASVSYHGSLNELRLGGIGGLMRRDAGNRVYQGNGFGGLLGGTVLAPLSGGDSYGILVLSTDLIVLGTGTHGFFGRTGGDIGGGMRVESSRFAVDVWGGYHGIYDTFGTNPDSKEVGYYEHGLLLRTRVTLAGFGIDAGAAGLLGKGWTFQTGLRYRLSQGMSVGSHAEWHTVGTKQNGSPPGTVPVYSADWGRDVLTVSLFVAIHP
jgi:hypothetical protein